MDLGSCPSVEEQTCLEVPGDLEEVLTVEADSSAGFLGSPVEAPTSILPLVEAPFFHPLVEVDLATLEHPLVLVMV